MRTIAPKAIAPHPFGSFGPAGVDGDQLEAEVSDRHKKPVKSCLVRQLSNDGGDALWFDQELEPF